MKIRGYHPYDPDAATRALIEQVNDLLVTNRAYLPLSLRQLFYLGVSSFAWPKTEKFYKGFCAKMSRARRASMIDFEDIRDDGITEEKPHTFQSKYSFLNAVRNEVENFQLDPMQDQPHDLVVWTEGKGLVPMVRRFTEDYRVPVITSGGFDGLTLKHQIAQRFAGRDAVILHVGDYDPSGEVMFHALAEDVMAFGGQVEFRRIAVTRLQIDQHRLPTKPPKRAGNTHAASFDDDITVELEALPPHVLQQILIDNLGDAMDLDALDETNRKSRQIRADLLELLDNANI